MFLVYKTTNKITGKIYIGCHITKNLQDGYLGSGILLKRAIKKYGQSAFSVEVLEYSDTAEEMLLKERELVDEMFVKNDNTYNLTLGGGSFWHLNSTGKNIIQENIEIFDKVRILGPQAHQMLLQSSEYRDRWRKNVSTGLKNAHKAGKYPDAPFAGKKHTDESKKKIGDKNRLRQQGSSNSQFGKCWITNEETKENKSIRCEKLADWIDLGWKKGRYI